MSISSDVISRTKKFEGSVSHMYLDTAGFVTVGVGNLLSTAESAAAQPFIKKANDVAATIDEKKADWQNVKKQTAGKIASYYDQFTLLKLKQEDVDSFLKSKLESFENELVATFSDYTTFPPKAQEGVLDMIFNLGLPKLLTFVNFIAAVKAKSWSQAAAECSRGGVSQERNDEIKKLFETAAKQSSIEGQWNGQWSRVESTGPKPASIQIKLSKSGANLTGSISQQYNGAFSDVVDSPISEIVADTTNNVSFLWSTYRFKGKLSADFTQIAGEVVREMPPGAKPKGPFKVTRI